MSKKVYWSMLVLALMAAPAQAGLAGGGLLAPGTPIGDDFVLGGTTPGKWGPPVFGTGATVTWGYMPTGTPTAGEHPGTFTHFDDFMPVGYHAEVVAAFAAWSAVADLTFVFVGDTSMDPFNSVGGLTPDIRVGGAIFDGPSGVLAHAYFPPVNGVSAAGDVHFDVSELWKTSFGGPGFDIFQVMAHELGHSLGLSHTPVPMSLMNPFYTEAFSGPQADDIAGMVFIYGPAAGPGAVPEPASVILMVVGGAGLAGYAARRRNRTAA
jgi:hypothetical protein